jgi:NADH-quinone oxidoreductase subunit J
MGYAAFGFVLCLTLGGALVAVLPRNIVQNVFGLALSLTGVAGIYVFLNSGFLAVMQVLIYIGAICVAIIFAIMLSEPMQRRLPPRARPKVILAFLVATGVMCLLGVVLSRTQLPPAVTGAVAGDWSIKHLGLLLFTRYEFMFEVISLVLLVAILGAIITAAVLKPEGKNGGEEEGGAA